MTNLTDTQLVVLSAAAARDDQSVLPLPKSLKGGAVTKVLDSLIRKSLIEKIKRTRFALKDSYKITQAGLRAINADDKQPAQSASVASEPESGATPPAKKDMPETSGDSAGQGQESGKATVKTRSGTKQAAMIGLLQRKEGATIAQLQEVTGWLPHTCRGAISGALKKKLGLTITSAKTDTGQRTYNIIAS